MKIVCKAVKPISRLWDVQIIGRVGTYRFVEDVKNWLYLAVMQK